MTQDELTLVLDALKWCHGGEPCGTAQAIAVVEKTLAQPEQEPVALEKERKAFEEWIDSGFINKGHAAFCKFSDRDAYYIDEIQNKWKAWKERAKRTPTTPHRTWLGLTAGEILDTLISVDEKTVRLPSMLGQFACAIEAKLKEKNNA